MKILTAAFILLASHATIAHADGNAAPVHPAQALHHECMALEKLISPSPPASQSPEFTAMIKAGREKVIAYTKSHAGDDLDSLHWGNAIQSIYMTSAFCEWKTARESEHSMREIWKILGQVTAQEAQKLPDLCLDVMFWHIQGWTTIDPESCATIMDEAALLYLPKASPNAIIQWKFLAPFYEEQFMANAAKLPPGRRAAFKQKREDRLFLSTQDETVPLLTRSDQLAAYATRLYSQGEAERATALLDAWWQKHGEKIQSTQYYSARFHTACYGTGDWAKARATLRQMEKLAIAGVISPEEDLYKLVQANYYQNIAYSEYELKRRAVQRNKEKKEAKEKAEK